MSRPTALAAWQDAATASAPVGVPAQRSPLSAGAPLPAGAPALVAACLSSEDAVSRCTRDGSLELVYQPEVDLQTGAIRAMEALLRWHHAELDLAPPELLLLADSTGRGTAVEDWVLEHGAAEAATWQALPGPVRQLWVNVSAHRLADPDLPARYADVVRRHALPPGALGLEVSEGAVRALGAAAVPAMRALVAAGAPLAVDDVESWMSVLGAMEVLPVSVVKLGHRHVRGVDADDRAPVVEAVVAAAHERGLTVVAEGVETWGEAARLTEIGCDRAHGWLYASPQRADKARWLLAHGAGWRGDAVRPGDHAAAVGH